MNIHNALSYAIRELSLEGNMSPPTARPNAAADALTRLRDALPKDGLGLRDCAHAAEERMLQGNPHPAWEATARGCTEARMIARALDA